MSEPRRPNHLEGQTSPYLLQHLYNPVDWHPWGDEALQRARDEDRPIFLSIGYAACHWCHVMERESFENPAIAGLLNRHFVSIKVDREERPDVDEIYMNAVQVLTGAGGWPLNVFLTPDRRPFFGGTYFPPEGRYGRPGFPELLSHLVDAWQTRRDEVERSAGQMTEQLVRIARGAPPGESEPVGRSERQRGVADWVARFDPRWGGFGNAPKFPPDGALAVLLREHGRSGESMPLQVAERTLQGMALGGLLDQIGGGFARYSVDEQWLIPHFEKMLYNQALLVPVFLDGFQITGKPLYRQVVERTLDFVTRELADADGGFHSSLDADSEGEEGRFYVWTPDQVQEVLGDQDGALFCSIYDITTAGNFEGANNPNLLKGTLAERAAELEINEPTLEARMSPLRARLLEARGTRVRPATDDKVLTSWNGLMIGAFARAHQVLGRQSDLVAARGAADFLLATRTADGRLRASHRNGVSALNGYLDDYAFLARGLVDLYEACFDPTYLHAAAALARTMVDHFEDREQGGFFFTSDDHERLLTRNRSFHDGALPAGAGVAAEALLRLAFHLGDDGLAEPARRTLIAYRPVVERAPSGFASLLVAADYAEGPVDEIVLIGVPGEASTEDLLKRVRCRYIPRRVLAVGAQGHDGPDLPLLADRPAVDGRPTAYVCRDRSCAAPTTDHETLERLLGEGPPARREERD